MGPNSTVITVLARSAKGPALVPVWPCAFSSPVTFGGQCGVSALAASSKGTV